MAERILALLGVVLGGLPVACQAGPLSLVECGIGNDCPEKTYCDAVSHTCASEEPLAPTPPATPSYTGDLLTWDARGTVLSSQNKYGIGGPWHLYDDCGDVASRAAAGLLVCPSAPSTPNCCTVRDATLVGPAPESTLGYSVTGGVVGESSGRACTRGVTTQAFDAAQWGAGFALELGNWGAFDGTQAFLGGHVIGLSFDLEGPSTGTGLLDAGISTQDSYYFKRITVPTLGATVLFDDVKSRSSDASPPLFDPTRITALAFQIPSISSSTTPFDFCVTNVHVLLDQR